MNGVSVGLRVRLLRRHPVSADPDWPALRSQDSPYLHRVADYRPLDPACDAGIIRLPDLRDWAGDSPGTD